MKQRLLHLLIAAFAIFSFGATRANAAEGSVTFTPSSFSVASSVAYGNTESEFVDVAVSNGTVTAERFSVFKNQTLTITLAEGLFLTKVQFTCTANGSNQYGPGCFTSKSGSIAVDGKEGTWTPTAKMSEVVLTAELNQVRATELVVYYTDDANVSFKKSAELKFSVSEISIEKDVDAFVAPEFTKATTADVSFVSSDESVATVSDAGVIALAGGVGTTTVTATSAANDEYEAGETSVTIVVSPTLTRAEYEPATSIAAEGGDYVFVVKVGDKLMYGKAIDTDNSYGYIYLDDVLMDGEAVMIPTGSEFTFAPSGDGYTIANADGRGLYLSGTYKSFQLGDATADNVWTVAFDEAGACKLSMMRGEAEWSVIYTLYGITPELIPSNTAGAEAAIYLYKAKVSTAIGAQPLAKPADSKCYNLMGQEVGAGFHGIMIKGGKMMIRK